MPISLLEAMSYGKNCLVSDIEENTQVTGKYATTFKRSNLDSLVDSLGKCIKGYGRFEDKEISDYIIEKYDWNNIVERTVELYKNKTKGVIN